MKKWMTAWTLVVAAAACGRAPDAELPADESSPIVGGFDAKAAVYDSVGALVVRQPDGSIQPFCTATLIGPKLIVSAKHCFLLTPRAAEVSFAIGYDASAPRRLVRLVNPEWERGEVGESITVLGADVAVARLAEAVTDVEPLRTGVTTAADIGKKFLAVGYGMNVTLLYDPANPPPWPTGAVSGRRKAATRALRARDGQYWPLVYPSYEVFREAYRASVPESAASPDFEQSAQKEWDGTRIRPDYDLVFGAPSGEGQACSGDSGGPILRIEGSRWTVVGVVSGYIRPLTPPGPFWTCPDTLNNYSTFGPVVQHMLDAARACGEVTQQGTCDGNAAVRCTRATEGLPRVVRSECGEVGQVCAPTPTEPVCAPGCLGDDDCNALAPRGKCDLPTNRCHWAPSCLDERDHVACLYCCYAGPHGEVPACTAECQQLSR
jgi:hypothetical protein